MSLRSLAEYSEDALVEQPAIKLLKQLGWQTANCFDETFGPDGTLGRETSIEVVLRPRLRTVLQRLNPDALAEAIDAAIEQLTRDRSTLSPVHANREVYQLLKDGVKVMTPTFREARRMPHSVPTLGEGEPEITTLRVIDWEDPARNDFFLASQFWITGDMYKRRADLIGFVNGLPLVFIELKASHRRLRTAFDDNLRDYKTTIPPVFWTNAFIILSNGSQSKLGSLTSEWDHFSDWKRIDREGEPGVISLETMLRGTCQPDRLLDLIENFTLFVEASGGTRKLVAKNHQVLGVNNAIAAVHNARQNQGRLGVFWHTQGSGKSYSMVFFAQKILRKVPGNWTFVVVTDRDDLDRQIYQNFATAGATIEPEETVRAQSGDHLKQLLHDDHRYVFTLIQKFHTRDGGRYPQLSDRPNVIVMTDEAHRSQYDALALNMRNALPNAAYLAFTGTPLMAGEEKTRSVFGDYVSVYNFRQSIADNNTVPLYYENRIPELQLTNTNFNADLERVLDEAALDETQEAKLEREFAHEYLLITRNDRLEKIAEDIVQHFIGRGQRGKAMVVSIDKATAVRMYDKVRAHWQIQLAALAADLETCDPMARPDLEARLRYLQETDMAVVVSQSQNEVEDLLKKGADIRPHRQRLLREDLEEKFKNPDDPFRLVFVCAMWMTGFDAPACSTIYLDKPMRDHTLMQTIARANRVFGDKVNGLIVDYIGVFRNLQKALAIYGSAADGGVQPGDLPVKAKQALVEDLRTVITEARAFCVERGADLDAILHSDGFQRVRLLDDASKVIVDAQTDDAVEDSVDKIILNDDLKKRFLLLAANVDRLYRAILPDRSATDFSAERTLFVVMADKIRSFSDDPDISHVMDALDDLLDRSVSAQPYVIRKGRKPIDLSQIDFAKLQKRFAHSHQHIEIERLRALIERQLDQLVRFNPGRLNLVERFQRLIDDYNAGSRNTEVFFKELIDFARQLSDEEKRHVALGLSEEELAIFDLLTKPEPKLTKTEEQQVKKVAHDLLDALKREKLVLDWRKRQQSRALVRLAIEEMLDRLPDRYSRVLYQQKCEVVYQHVYDAYYGTGGSAYGAVA